VNFDIMDQLLIRYSVFVNYWPKSGNIMGQYFSYLQISKRSMISEKYCTIFSVALVYL